MRNRLTGETITDYVYKLRELAQPCNFEEDSLDEDIMLRDRLVCGINNDAIRRRLLMEPKLTLVQALWIAEEQGQSLEVVYSVSNKNNTFVCYRCGKSAYRPAN